MNLLLPIERKLKRIFKVIKGSYYTITGKGSAWTGDYWDSEFYTEGVSDRQTISSQKGLYSSLHHYASVEMHLLRHFVNQKIDLSGSLLDIGSGAGHWIDFYRQLGAQDITSLEVSENCVQHLREKYGPDSKTTVLLGQVKDVAMTLEDESFDFVNAIGVLFHIVDDRELSDCLQHFFRVLKPGGYLIVGGNFGHWPFNINTQVKHGRILNKRLRSRWWWSRQLRRLGFRDLAFRYNTAYAYINDRTPENSVLVCRKQD